MDENISINCESNNKNETDGFQKMLKLREGIRKRNLKSASSSRNHLDTIPGEENDITMSSIQYEKLPGYKLK